MKVVQIFNGQVHCDLSNLYNTAEEGSKHYAPNILLVDAPNYVFPGWGYNSSLEGNERFIQPSVPEGFEYDIETGTVWNPKENRKIEREQLHAETSNDTLQALRKLREGDQSYDWQTWLDKLDAYNKAIEDTQLQETYPDKVVYPEYPQR